MTPDGAMVVSHQRVEIGSEFRVRGSESPDHFRLTQVQDEEVKAEMNKAGLGFGCLGSLGF